MRRLWPFVAVGTICIAPWPAKINVDGNSATHRGLRLLAAEDRRCWNVEVGARRYLNNVVEQDHRAIADAVSQCNAASRAAG
jgi:transposase-like protein